MFILAGAAGSTRQATGSQVKLTKWLSLIKQSLPTELPLITLLEKKAA
jgi:hypothetical protein